MKKNVYEIPEVEIEYVSLDDVITGSVMGPKDNLNNVISEEEP